MNTTCSFTANVWLYPGDAAWHFVSLPKQEAQEIGKMQALRQAQGKPRRGFGAVRVKATVLRQGSGQVGTSWETSMFPDKRSGTYILPLKASIRKKEGIASGDRISLSIRL